jgi:chitin disaccharide deacetylase
VREEPVSDEVPASANGHSAGSGRWLVVNADDFGATSGVNDGIVEAHERGIVTSASMMVRGAAAASAADYARAHPQLGLGLHVELRDWRVRRRPLPGVRSEEALCAAVAADLREQLDEFRRLVGRNPTHLDSHHHRHRIDALRPIFLGVAGELDVPLRHLSPGIHFCGEFYGHDGRGRPEPQAITPGALAMLLERLPPGVTELSSHPGYPQGLRAWYREERLQEVRTLCDPDVRDAVERLEIELVTFADVRTLLER